MPNTLEARVAGALTNVRNARVDNDVISSGMIRDLAVDAAGTVSLTFVLSRDDPAGIVREVRQALREVEGVTDVKIRVEEPRAAASTVSCTSPSTPSRDAPAAFR